MTGTGRRRSAASAVDPAAVRARVEPPRRTRDPAGKRARILEAATVEFSRYGYDGGRSDRVAQRAGTSERMVYYYYGSKEGLFRAVLEQVYLALRQAELALDLSGLTPRRALSHFCRFVWRYYLEHPEFIGLVNTENLHQARHLRDSSQLGQLVSPIVEKLRALLEDGRARGEFRAGIDPVDLYICIASLGYFYLSNSHTLSAVLGRGLRSPERLDAHWVACDEMIQRFVSA